MKLKNSSGDEDNTIETESKSSGSDSFSIVTSILNDFYNNFPNIAVNVTITVQSFTYDIPTGPSDNHEIKWKIKLIPDENIPIEKINYMKQLQNVDDIEISDGYFELIFNKE